MSSPWRSHLLESSSYPLLRKDTSSSEDLIRKVSLDDFLKMSSSQKGLFSVSSPQRQFPPQKEFFLRESYLLFSLLLLKKATSSSSEEHLVREASSQSGLPREA